MPHPPNLTLGHTDRDELLKAAVLIQNADRSIICRRLLASHLRDLL
jgi:hypothetical protein